MKLVSKTILIISPQKWSDFMVSKHHYAKELALKGNEVFFLNPVAYGNEEIEVLKNPEIQGLNIVSHSFAISSKIRFHARWFFDLLMRRRIKKIINQIGKPIDIVWCFEPNLITNLNWFQAKLKIFHPVDFLNENHQLSPAKTADVILSVANNILDFLKGIKVPKYFINHGLSTDYSTLSIKEYRPNHKLKVCYIGNLMIQGLDRVSMRTIIEKHPNVRFDFYGNYSLINERNKNATTFVQFLMKQPNVKLLGVFNPKELSELLFEYDATLLCYKPNEELNSGSNSHKLLEYLSTGRVTISSLVDTYKNHAEIIVMSKSHKNQDYVGLFDYAINNINTLNDIKLMNKRRELALSNTYGKQIEKIESLLSTLS